MRKKKKVEEICKNCKIYDPDKSVCRVVVLHEGQRINLPVDPEDKCFFQENELADEIRQVRFWTEDEKGQKTDGNGTVKMEYPEGFFGTVSIRDILG